MQRNSVKNLGNCTDVAIRETGYSMIAVNLTGEFIYLFIQSKRTKEVINNAVTTN
jgi:hypothetical protein